MDARQEVTKYLEENIAEIVHNLGISDVFGEPTPMARERKKRVSTKGLCKIKKLLHG